MSYNHQSFLKMIGIEDDEPKELSQTEAMVEAAPEEEQQESQVEYEQESSEPIDTASLNQAIEEAISEPTEIYRAATDENYRSAVVEKTEVISLMSRVSQLSRISRVEATEVFTQVENSMDEIVEDVSTGLSDLSLDGTRPTVAFDYKENDAPAEEASGTAHFDYDKDLGDCRLVVLDGKANAKAFHLANLPLRIGRDPENELVIDESNISRFHAEIRRRDDDLIIVDLGSTNGVKVNGLLASEQILHSHDILQIGDLSLEFLGSGELSKGIVRAVVEQTPDKDSKTITPQIAKKKKRTKLLAAGLVIFAIGYYLVTNSAELKKQAQEKSIQVFQEQVESSVTDLRTALERDAKKSITEIPAEEVKKSFIDRVSQSALSNFIPSELKQQIQSVPPEIIRVLLEDPKIIASAAVGGVDKEGFEVALRTRLNALVVQKRYSDALMLTQFLLRFKPNDQSLTSAAEKLTSLVAVTAANQPVDGITKDERQQIDNYLSDYQKRVEGDISKGRIASAIQFAKLVHERILLLVQKDARFEKVGKIEAANWEEKIKNLEKMQIDSQRRQAQAKIANQDADRLLRSIKTNLDMANTSQARNEIDEFIKKYPNHSSTREVSALRQEMQRALQITFATVKSNIERFIQAESYEAAWQELYRYLDMAPSNSEAEQLKEIIEKKTTPKAMQYYNQARVFEFEADDLIAAEQYYKRSLDVADPRGELSKKANRRYLEVRRKTIQ
ncbi:MAG: FHA domain-containing protein [Deltaproteobacteria bacterium]|nr:FHA domain-containing protein [Deltaproteobacteria bacterium]